DARADRVPLPGRREVPRGPAGPVAGAQLAPLGSGTTTPFARSSAWISSSRRALGSGSLPPFTCTPFFACSSLNSFHDAYPSGSSSSGQIAFTGDCDTHASQSMHSSWSITSIRWGVVISKKQSHGHGIAQYV